MPAVNVFKLYVEIPAVVKEFYKKHDNSKLIKKHSANFKSFTLPAEVLSYYNTLPEERFYLYLENIHRDSFQAHANVNMRSLRQQVKLFLLALYYNQNSKQLWQRQPQS